MYATAAGDPGSNPAFKLGKHGHASQLGPLARPGPEDILRRQFPQLPQSGRGRARGPSANPDAPRADANLRYQDALDWRKWTKGGWDFPSCPRSFEKAVMVVKW